jgi:prepilin signal peptidase PulO-like enzyme (type II secretory pathway)
MKLEIIVFLVAVGLFLGMLLLLEVGRSIGIRRQAKDAEGSRAGLGAVEGAIFGLMGLLVAFTFSGAAARFDARRQLIVEETNAIGTAYLRLDLLPADAQKTLRGYFQRYVEVRLEAYRKLPDVAAAMKEIERGAALQRKIWQTAVAACQKESQPVASMLLLPALNQMIDITTTRTMAAQIHPPLIVFIMLAVTALASALLAGYSMAGGKTRSWVHTIAFAAIMAVTLFVILDIEYPRLGWIRIDAFDQALVELQQSMKE